jgi:hypothetical protein
MEINQPKSVKPSAQIKEWFKLAGALQQKKKEKNEGLE